MPTRFGSKRYDDYDVAFDASVVQILRRAGCVVMGKTVTTELAFTMTGKHTLNPRNTKLSPGGSSSGSAAAVADNQVQIAVGTQTFGSVTRPASYCGIYGWKPTWGLISTVGGKFCSPTLDTIGFFARNVQDLKNLATVFNAEMNDAIPQDFSSWKIGLMVPLGYDAATDDAKAVFKQSEEILKEAGATTETFELPASFEKVLIHQRMVAVKELATSWRTEGDIQGSDDIMIRNFYEEGKNTAYSDYLEALDNLAKLRREFDDLARKYTFIISLSATGEAPTGLEYTGDSRFNTMSTALHFPVVNVPGLTSRDGNPIGLSVIGGRGRDMQVLEASAGLSSLIEGRL
ncbi:Glutamyl-tRNA amidotransferase subunit A [Cystobasidium minutum MCA 4210]|uniref:Glutamyl-tRNA amidotransferase subunit A n=1 Tax=Cystobasidium minutum MCA 4210 TaxID=1397322 RepID=UPI0034CE9BD9|eukprot:jgi/Rhomi1/16106/CE16105_949